MTRFETKCALCTKTLYVTIIRDIPDFCNSCYMTKIHPKVEQMIQNSPAGKQIPEHCALVKIVLSLFK